MSLGKMIAVPSMKTGGGFSSFPFPPGQELRLAAIKTPMVPLSRSAADSLYQDPVFHGAVCFPADAASLAAFTCPYEAIYLVTGGGISAVIENQTVALNDGSLVLLRGYECRSCRIVNPGKVTIWALYYTIGTKILEGFSCFQDNKLVPRVLRLSDEQRGEFKNVFIRISAEASMSQTGNGMAEAAWLRLLFVMIQRWSESRKPAHVGVQNLDPDLVGLWNNINEHVYHPDGEICRKFQNDLPNYDSLRHRFQKVFGMSPQKMLMSMRMDAAKSLLLESSLSIKEIAEKLGYGRQHEFCRAFKKWVGVCPTHWKSNPISPIAGVEKRMISSKRQQSPPPAKEGILGTLDLVS